MASGAQAAHNRPLLTRISEQALVGIIAASATLYTDNIKHDEEIRQITQEVREIKQEMRETIRQMRQDLYIPRSEERGRK